MYLYSTFGAENLVPKHSQMHHEISLFLSGNLKETPP